MSTWGQPRANQRSGSVARSARLEPSAAAAARARRDRLRSVFQPVSSPSEIAKALDVLPSAVCVMTAAHEHKRTGMLVSRVMRAADEPLSIAVSVPTGQRLTMLLRDSRAFGLCFLDPSRRATIRRFDHAHDAEMPSMGDPFETQPTRTLVTGAPLLTGSLVALDCEVVRHFDLESDHEIYVGLVLGCFVDEAAMDALRNGPLTPIPVRAPTL